MPPNGRKGRRNSKAVAKRSGKHGVVARGQGWWNRFSLRRAVRDAEQIRVGSIVEVSLPLAVGTIGGMAGFGLLTGWWWGVGWLVLFFGGEIFTRIRRGGTMRQFINRIEQVNGSIAGGIDTLAQYMNNAHDSRLTDGECHTICIGLLARIKDYVVVAVGGADHEERLRVTLCVPISSTGGTAVDRLRVWCYDQPYQNREWSTFELGWPGAPAAFRTGTPQVIVDINATARKLGIEASTKKYCAIASIPVVAGGPKGKRLGVVNIDSKSAGFFAEEMLEQKILPLVAPVVNLVALVLMMRRVGIAYTFER